MSTAVKEKIITSFNASTLATHESEVMPVDRIGAMAKASPLGSALWHTLNLESSALRQAIYSLAKQLRRDNRISQDLAVKLATQAIRERFIPQCKTCAGSTEVIRGGVRKICPECDGTGMRRYSDFDRASALGVSLEVYNKGWMARLLCLTIEMLDAIELKTMRAVSRGLR